MCSSDLSSSHRNSIPRVNGTPQKDEIQMSDCTVNIADFRSFHVMKALRTDAPRPQPTAKDGDFTLPIHLCQLDFGSRDARVLDISMIREAWLNGHRARNKIGRAHV